MEILLLLRSIDTAVDSQYANLTHGNVCPMPVPPVYFRST